MNEVLYNRELLLNSDNEGILNELLSRAENYNVFWGSEYIIMNEKKFIENHGDEIIEMMVKSRMILQGGGARLRTGQTVS